MCIEKYLTYLNHFKSGSDVQSKNELTAVQQAELYRECLENVAFDKAKVDQELKETKLLLEEERVKNRMLDPGVSYHLFMVFSCHTSPSIFTVIKKFISPRGAIKNHPEILFVAVFCRKTLILVNYSWNWQKNALTYTDILRFFWQCAHLKQVKSHFSRSTPLQVFGWRRPTV